MNPGGSVKDRAALAIIEDAEESGALRPGGMIVEGTAGNTGIGLTMVGNAKGYIGHRNAGNAEPGKEGCPSRLRCRPASCAGKAV